MPEMVANRTHDELCDFLSISNRKLGIEQIEVYWDNILREWRFIITTQGDKEGLSNLFGAMPDIPEEAIDHSD